MPAPTQSSPTIGQVVSSSYGWGNGELEPETFLDEADVPHSSEYYLGDTLLQFLLQETVEGSLDWSEAALENGPEHWAEARHRIGVVLREVQAVHDALMRFGPPEVAEVSTTFPEP